MSIVKADEGYWKCQLKDDGCHSICIGYYKDCEKKPLCNCINKGYNNLVNNVVINEPKQLWYGKKVHFDIVLDNKAKIEYSVNNGRNRILCRNCDKFTRNLNFNNGENTVKIIAAGIEKEIKFNVDKIKPKIYSLPRKSDGNIRIYYKEDNLKEVVLYYGASRTGTFNKMVNTGCSLQYCDFEIELKGTVYYFVEISDYVNTVKSSVRKITVK